MKSTNNVFWYLFLVYFVVHLILLPLCFFYNCEIIDLERFGVTEYAKEYLSRLFSTTLTFIVLFLFSLKGRFYLNKDKSFILFLLTTILFFDTIGNFWGWFDVDGILKYLWYDDVVHFFSPILVSLSGVWYLYVMKGNDKYLSIITASAVSLTLSSLWEVYEYWSDKIYGTEMLKGGIEDTMSDMTFGFLGVFLFFFLFYLFTKKK